MNAAAHLDRRRVAVPADHGAKSGRRGIKVDLIHVVYDVENRSFEFDHFGFGQRRGPGSGIDIAANRGDGRDGAKRVEDVGRADVAGMDDVSGAAQGIERLGAQETMCIGDQADGGHAQVSQVRPARRW